MTLVEWAWAGLAFASESGKSVDDLCTFLKAADGFRQLIVVKKDPWPDAKKITIPEVHIEGNDHENAGR